MKFLFTFFIFVFISAQTFAADTTKIRTHDKVVIKTNPSKGFTEYPAKIGFPADSVAYRKAYLYLEFGCAPGLKCGEWDYGNHIFLIKDSIKYEIARFITPYGFYWNSGQNWKHGWYYDLTDFSFLLHDSVTIVYQHSGYEANNDRGWTVIMDFTFVEGMPARIPKGYNQIYRLSAPFGNVNNPFDSVVRPKSFVMPAESDMVNFKTIQTGHGMDKQENCAEFCSKTRTIKLDNQIISVENVWRDNCGFNSLYPQAGTWIYDRAGWCPGASVIPSDVFAMLPENSTHDYQLEMESYSNTSGGSANYMLTSIAQFFKDNRKQTDAAIDDILTPSSHFENLRLNPTCGAPILRVRNMGKDTIKSLDFLYGKMGGALQIIWVQTVIPPFQTKEVTLEVIYNWRGAGNTFIATITKVNGKADEYTEDNTMYSEITNSPTFPNKIYVVFKSNSAPTENYYTLKDAKGKLILSKNNFMANTIYRDTVYLDNNICYTFEFFDDGPPPSNNPLNKDGLDWWANSADGSGYIQIRNGNSNAMLKNFNADFGTKHILNFQTTYSMDVQTNMVYSMQLDILPNPSSGETNIQVNVASGLYIVNVFDQMGRMVHTFTENSETALIQLSNLSSGIYTVSLQQGQQLLNKKFIVQ